MANRLEHEDSPYLQQHKDNPVEWYPWCDEAFDRAKKEKKTIFVSIGYSSCHWCHVMEKEVFEDATLATFLNEHFISIKVDKEERPDIDKHFQELHMLLNRRAGGWPTSIFLTPDNKPFYAGTYIPPTRRQQMIGFDELTKIIAEKIATDDTSLLQNADEITSFLKHSSAPKEATILKTSIMATFLAQAEHNYNAEFGGFSTQPKFPHTSTLHTLLDIFQLTENETALNYVTHTLDTMQLGGLYDLIDGGFCRYSTDEMWLVPHFEKMTYDNGLLIELYLRAYAITEDENYKRTALDTIEFMLHKMQKEKLFYSASDADSDGVEGKYFVYDYEKSRLQLERCFSKEECVDILYYFNITKDGNFEGENILRKQDNTLPSWYDNAIECLSQLRDPALYPFIDQKAIVSWNAMMIRSLFLASLVKESYLQTAEEMLDRLLETFDKDHTLYHSTLIGKEPTIHAFLEDHAYLSQCLLSAYTFTQEERYLMLAQKLCNDALRDFYQEGNWLFSKGEFITQGDITDNSYPGSVSVIVDSLLCLGNIVDTKYHEFAYKTLEYNSYNLMRSAIRYPKLTSCALRFLTPNYIFKQPMNALRTSFIDMYFSHPYVQIQRHSFENFMLCDQKSCFVNAQNREEITHYFNELDKKVDNS